MTNETPINSQRPTPTGTHERLQESEERFRILVEAVTDYAIYLLDPEGHVTTWNSGAQKIKGYTAEEIIGRHYSTFFTPEDIRAGKPEAELRIARTQGRYEEEGWRLRKDGSPFWCNVVLTAIHGPNAALTGFAKVTRDLTTRRIAEEAARDLIREQAARAAAEAGEAQLRAEHERYRALSEQLQVILEGIPDGITVQSRDGALLFANSAGARMCGFSTVPEFIAAPVAEITKNFSLQDEAGEPFALTELPGRRVLAGAGTASSLVRVRNLKTGADWWSLIRASGVGGTLEEPELAVNVWHDVSAERRTEEHQRYLARATGALAAPLNLDEMLHGVAKALVPGFADWCSIHLLSGEDVQTAAVAHSDPAKEAGAPAFLRDHPPDRNAEGGLWTVLRTGVSVLHSSVSSELLKRSLSRPGHAEAVENVGMSSLLIAPISTRGQVLGAIVLVYAESRRTYQLADVPVAEEIGRRVGEATENVTLFAKAQQAAKDAELAAQEAEAASRSKDEFLATVSHELRTPLNAITGWAALLQKRSVDPFVAKGVEVISRNARAQSKLIEDILDVSRVVTGKLRLELRAVDLVAVARDAIEVVRPSLQAKQIHLEFEPSRDFPVVVADPERMQQVLWNLLSNAVKFSTAGGRIVLTLSQEGSLCTVTVRDDGLGIASSFLPHVFERFKQADGTTTRRFGGLGLGLGIVRHIVELHGGAVSAASDGPGKGATFTFSLPIRALAPPSTKEASDGQVLSPPARHPDVSLGGLRVLVVDDEEDARELLEAVFTEAGALVSTAGSAAEGFVLLQELLPHVIISDIGMPGEDGFSFVRRVKAWCAEADLSVPCVALTAYARADDQSKALAAGFTAHIGKPVEPTVLLALVSSLARRSTPPS